MFSPEIVREVFKVSCYCVQETHITAVCDEVPFDPCCERCAQRIHRPMPASRGALGRDTDAQGIAAVDH
eukprot:6390011-Lingulodinium_polyedra.AAC.1